MERTDEFGVGREADDRPRTEELLFAALRSRPGCILSRKELLEVMHGKSRGNVQDHAVDATVARLRRALGPAGDCIETVRGRGFCWNPACVSVDPETDAVWVGGDRIGLTAGEAALLRKLAAWPERTFSRQELSSGGERTDPDASRAVDMAIASIRRKLGDASVCIVTDRGTGYRFQPSAASGRVPPSVRRTVLLLALGVLLAAAGLGALQIYRAVTAPPVLAESPTEPVAEE